MPRILFPLMLTVALAGCGKASDEGGAPDLGVAGGNGTDMAMVISMTIAGARQGNVTTPITVSAVVTAVQGDDPVDITTWYIQDPQGGPYSGIAVYCNHNAKSNPCPMAITPPKLHDLVTITGTIASYHGKAELYPTAQATQMANAAPPPVATASATDLAASGMPKTLWGSMVKLAAATTVDDVKPSLLYNSKCAGDGGVNGLCAGGATCAPSYYGFEIADASGNKILVENSFHVLTNLVSSPECTAAPGMTQVVVGGKLDFIQGILDVDPYVKTPTQILMPTAPSDFAYHQ